jgi:uncharacterized protein YqhQ
MSDRSPKPDDRTQYGGQAVVEGVMMRSPRFFAIACRRRSSGDVVVKLEPVSSALPPWLKWLNRPFLRGTAALIDAMAMGIRSLTYSANIQLEDELAAAKTASQGEPEAVQETIAAGAVNLAMGEGVALRPPADQRLRADEQTSASGDRTAESPAPASSQTINGIAIGATTVIALVFGFVLFWLIPAAITDALPGRHPHSFGSGAEYSHASTALHQFESSLIEGLIRLAIFFAYLLLISRMAHVQRVFEYHGAEHKAINTLEACLPLTIENARTVSRIHPRCGTNFIFIVLTTAIVVFSVVPRHSLHDGIVPMLSTHLLRLLLLPIVAGVAFEILKFAGTHRDKRWAMALIAPGLWTQYITTREPDDSQIEVAIQSLLAVWDKEHEGQTGETTARVPAVEVA